MEERVLWGWLWQTGQAGQVVERVGQLVVEELDGGEWKAVGDGTSKRRSHSCIVWEGKLWVVGGRGAGNR